ncbi:MAG: SusD/RagB family nutrient-binding outer membrane lipoprotein, partial [Bacteroidales bacterium]
DATADFKKAVEASFKDYQVSDSSPKDTEFENNGSEYAAALPVTLKEIMVQKYLSQCRDEQIEAYNDIRRCQALGENWIELKNPLNNQKGVNYWPERFPYGNSSVVSNPIIGEAFNNIDIYKDKVWLFGGSK